MFHWESEAIRLVRLPVIEGVTFSRRNFLLFNSVQRVKWYGLFLEDLCRQEPGLP